MKASTIPRAFHTHVSTFELNTTPGMISGYITDNYFPLRVLRCDIVHGTRVATPSCSLMHIFIDALNEEKKFLLSN